MYKVEVYNTYFGDCTILKTLGKKNSNLLVDFGIHANSHVSGIYSDKELLKQEIAEDISIRYPKRNINLLITHFHEDHVNGLIYMYKSGSARYKNYFKKVYMADVWEYPYAIAMLLLEDLLKKTKLPRTSFSLFYLLDFLSVCVNDIELLSRGRKFEDDRFITLWPEKNNKITPKTFMKGEFDDVIRELKYGGDIEKGLDDIEKGLIELSEKIVVFFRNELLQKSGTVRERKGQIKSFRKDYKVVQEKISAQHRKVNNLEGNNNTEGNNNKKIEEQILKLHELNHKFNIVFQNSDDENENILFTGDIEKNHMKKIADRTDIPLHKKYKYIKIPHHGTENHYFDYSKYNPETIIINNGRINVKCEQTMAYRIYREYRDVCAIHVCTNSNNCIRCYRCDKNCMWACTCVGNVVYPRLYIEC